MVGIIIIKIKIDLEFINFKNFMSIKIIISCYFTKTLDWSFKKIIVKIN